MRPHAPLHTHGPSRTCRLQRDQRGAKVPERRRSRRFLPRPCGRDGAGVSRFATARILGAPRRLRISERYGWLQPSSLHLKREPQRLCYGSAREANCTAPHQTLAEAEIPGMGRRERIRMGGVRAPADCGGYVEVESFTVHHCNSSGNTKVMLWIRSAPMIWLLTSTRRRGPNIWARSAKLAAINQENQRVV